MSLFCRQQRLVRKIDDAVGPSDLGLASMLAIFDQLTDGEEVPGREQMRIPPLSRIRAVLLAAAGHNPPPNAASPQSPAPSTRAGTRRSGLPRT